MTPNPKIGLALSGGAAYGAAHIGALQSLAAHDIRISCIAGTSAGAIVGALHAFDVPEERIIERLAKLSWRTIARLSVSKYGLISNASLGDILHDLLGDPHIEDARIPLAITATDITHGELVIFRTGPLIPALLASACLPGIFVPVTIDGKQLVDGGLVNNFPINELASLGADITVGVDVIPNTLGQPAANWFDVMNRSFDILSRGRNDTSTEHDIVIRPDLSPFSYSAIYKAQGIIAAGRHATDSEMPRITAAIAAYTQEHASSSFSSLVKSTREWFTSDTHE